MTAIVLGVEVELVVAVPPTSDEHDLLLAPREMLVQMLAIAEALYGARKTAAGRVQLIDGAMLYIDGQSLEYATPPCRTWDQVALHERDLTQLVVHMLDAYDELTGIRPVVLQPGVGPGGDACGYHENYGFRHHDYFRLFTRSNFMPTDAWRRALVPFLVTRILWSGSGGIRNGSFVISPRAADITHTYHHSTSPERPIVHLKRPQLTDEYLRVQITCGDANHLLLPVRLRIALTALCLLTAARGGFDDIDLALSDPVASMHQLTADPNTPLRLADGRTIHASEIQTALQREAATNMPRLLRTGTHAPDPGLVDAFDAWRGTL